MKKLFLLLALTFISAQSFAGSCPDGSEPIKSISEDGTYYVFNCEGGNKKASSSNTNINLGPVSINVHDEYQYNNFSGLVSLDFAFAIRTGFFGYVQIPLIDVNALNGKGSPMPVDFTGAIDELQLKGKFDHYFEMIIKLRKIE